MIFESRQGAFKALVGSHNYNLNTPESDKDYKIFVIPTFDDLYFGRSYNRDFIGDTEDCSIHDIRKLSSLLSKSNVNFLEVLFSEEFIIDEDLNQKSKNLILELVNMRDDIAKMNLAYLYDASIGMYFNKMRLVKKGTSKTTHLVDKFGYDTKQASQSWRILDFLERFAETNFSDFKSSIYYNNNDEKKLFILDLKNGVYSYDEFDKIISEKFNNIEDTLKAVYKSMPFDECIYSEVIILLQELIKINL